MTTDDVGAATAWSVAQATTTYVAARSELLMGTMHTGAMRPGPARRRALTVLTDDWIRTLFVAAGADGIGAALVAVGGYGRGDLVAGSDLDLLLLHPSGVDIAGVADRIWYPVWDGAVRLDHSVRTTAQARRLASQDLRVVLGLLDARTVAGDDDLTATLRSWVFEDWRALAPRRLVEMRAGVLERVARHSELAHLLEPDLKESYGGLRDVTALRAIEASSVVGIDHTLVPSAAEVLLDVRDALHQITGRTGDKLLLQEQGPVADVLGYGDVDALLRSVSGAGRVIAYASDTAWHRVDRAVTPKHRGPLRRLRSPARPDREPLADGVVVQDGEAVLAMDARPDRDPVLVLRAAAAAAQAGLRLSHHTVKRLAAESAPMPVPWPTAARNSLVSLLGARRAALAVWEALDQAGLIARLIPEWEAIRSAPQRNPVHTYTVDRHCVEAAINATAFSRRVSRPDLLHIGALFHDIGKARGGNHCEIGVALVHKIAPRLGFDSADSRVIESLVAHHLLLPEMATRRDLSDSATAVAVAEVVGNLEVLELLYALTEADAAATGPLAWTPWKATLVSELVSRTRGVLAGTPPPEPPKLSDAQHALADGQGVQVLITQGAGALEVTVAADDRVGLLATVAGVLALNRLEVRAARTETVGSRAVTVWAVQPAFGTPPEVQRLREDIQLGLRGGIDIATKLRERERAYRRVWTPPPPPPDVKIVHDASSRATVLEVRAADAPGLLFTIASTISAAGVAIDAARVSTLGSDVVDVFYLVAAPGVPLCADEQDRVSAALRQRLDQEWQATVNPPSPNLADSPVVTR